MRTERSVAGLNVAETDPTIFKMRPSIYLKNLQSASNWRAQFNPLRGLTLPHLVALLEQGERGDYARLQWLYRFVEKRNSTLRAVLQRRQASLTRLDWDVRVVAGGGSDPRALAARQAALLRDAYGRIENLREAVTFLALSEFRGYAHLERHVDRAGADGEAGAGAAVVLGAAGAGGAVAIQRDGAAGPADAGRSGAGSGALHRARSRRRRSTRSR